MCNKESITFCRCCDRQEASASGGGLRALYRRRLHTQPEHARVDQAQGNLRTTQTDDGRRRSLAPPQAEARRHQVRPPCSRQPNPLNDRRTPAAGGRAPEGPGLGRSGGEGLEDGAAAMPGLGRGEAALDRVPQERPGRVPARQDPPARDLQDTWIRQRQNILFEVNPCF